MHSSQNHAEELSSLLRANGASIIGFADLREISPESRDNYVTGVSIAVALNPRIVAGIQDKPTPEYYEEYNQSTRCWTSWDIWLPNI